MCNVGTGHSTVFIQRVEPHVAAHRQPAHSRSTGDRERAGGSHIARPAVQLDLVRSPAQLLRVGVPRDLLVLVGGGEHDIARRPLHDPLTGVRLYLRHQRICC